MGRVINLIIYCQNGKGRYRAYFEERVHGHWYGIRSEKMPDLSFFEKLSLKNQHKKSSSGSLALKSFKVSNTSAGGNFSGEFYSGSLRCPTCGNSNFVKCHRCGELTCWNGKSNFVCAVCGNSGEVKGTISDVSANSSGGGTKQSTSNNKYDNKKR